MKRFDNKIAYITGGSSGIGLEIARLLRGERATVVLIARNHQRLAEAKRELIATVRHVGDVPVHTLALDVGDSSLVTTSIPDAVQRFGTPDLLFNCAGVALPGRFEQIPLSELQESMKTNVEGTWNMIQSLLPWLKHRRGHIVNVSSVAGFVGLFGYTAYAASKFAVIGLSESLRNEFRPEGIGVSVLCPPDTDTEMLARENLRKPVETAALSAGASVVSPISVARACLRGVRARRFMILVGLESRLVYWLKRLAPWFLFKSMDRMVRKSYH